MIRGKAYKGEEGQYFTPQSVVRVAVAGLDPQPQDRVIDPACGSGSFLATAMGNVVDHLRCELAHDENALALEKREWSTHQLYAIDKDSVSIRLSKAYLSMLGDGSTHVYKADSIRPSLWPASLKAAIQESSFDVVVTNPPFGTLLKVPPAVSRAEGFELAHDWRKVAGRWVPGGDFVERDLGLIMLERCMRLLRPGGRLAIVLPDTYLFSDSYGWLVQWIGQFTVTHSINVPIEAFEPHCRAKTSVLIVRKETPRAGHRILGSVCETFGEDKHGRPRFKFVGDQQTAERDDEMAEAAALLRAGDSAEESKLRFTFDQSTAVQRGNLVASYWWRAPFLATIQEFATAHDCNLVSVDELIDAGELQVLDGHGSPNSHYKGRGTVPYVKVVDIKN